MSLNKYLQNKDSLGAKQPKVQTAMERDITFEKTPNTFPTQISKGTLASNLGGVFELRDATGGTVLLTADPETGVVTINGAISANVNVNIGTLTSPTIMGNSVFIGTMASSGIMTGGTIGTASIVGGTLAGAVITTTTFTGGTVNPTVLLASGSAGIDGTTIYVKNLVPGDLGTMVFKAGLLISSA